MVFHRYVSLGEEHDDPPLPNLAGQGRSGWQLLGVDEDNCQPVSPLSGILSSPQTAPALLASQVFLRWMGGAAGAYQTSPLFAIFSKFELTSGLLPSLLQLFALDLTGGRVPNNEQNALLSDEAKTFMAYLAGLDPERCVAAWCSAYFRIRGRSSKQSSVALFRRQPVLLHPHQETFL